MLVLVIRIGFFLVGNSVRNPVLTRRTLCARKALLLRLLSFLRLHNFAGFGALAVRSRCLTLSANLSLRPGRERNRSGCNPRNPNYDCKKYGPRNNLFDTDFFRLQFNTPKGTALCFPKTSSGQRSH
jgi:hypothetical protein